jgi:hypothetical protein
MIGEHPFTLGMHSACVRAETFSKICARLGAIIVTKMNSMRDGVIVMMINPRSLPDNRPSIENVPESTYRDEVWENIAKWG